MRMQIRETGMALFRLPEEAATAADMQSRKRSRGKGDFVCAKKLGEGGIDVSDITETFRWNPAGANPAW
jgi:hypothetical protein